MVCQLPLFYINVILMYYVTNIVIPLTVAPLRSEIRTKTFEVQIINSVICFCVLKGDTVQTARVLIILTKKKKKTFEYAKVFLSNKKSKHFI